eukprot:6185799-Amphidinium_carterae.1
MLHVREHRSLAESFRDENVTTSGKIEYLKEASGIRSRCEWALEDDETNLWQISFSLATAGHGQ